MEVYVLIGHGQPVGVTSRKDVAQKFYSKFTDVDVYSFVLDELDSAFMLDDTIKEDPLEKDVRETRERVNERYNKHVLKRPQSSLLNPRR